MIYIYTCTHLNARLLIKPFYENAKRTTGGDRATYGAEEVCARQRRWLNIIKVFGGFSRLNNYYRTTVYNKHVSSSYCVKYRNSQLVTSRAERVSYNLSRATCRDDFLESHSRTFYRSAFQYRPNEYGHVVTRGAENVPGPPRENTNSFLRNSLCSST